MKLDEGYYNSPRWSYEILDCSMPMTFDTYSNCAHQCLYCFSFFQRAVGDSAEDYLNHTVRAVNVERVKRMFTNPEEHGNQFAWYIQQRRVMQWGGLSDGFDWYEKKFKKSLELLKFFRSINYPISISTKGIWWLYEPEYREVIEGYENLHLKISMITMDEKKAKVLEAGVPSPEKRFKAMEEAISLGVSTSLRMRPFIIGATEDSYEEMLRRAKDIGAYGATTEFFCIEGRSTNIAAERWKRMSEVLGYDLERFYKMHSSSRSGLMRLNYEIKRPYIEHMEAICKEIDLPFFVSDSHHKEKSAHCNCCAVPETGELGNSFKGHFAEAILIAKREGVVRWEDIRQEAENLKAIPFYRAEGFNAGGTKNRAVRRYQSMYDYMLEAWNNTKSLMSPARYFGGVLIPGDLDSEGNIVYYYNTPFVEEGIRSRSAGELFHHLGIDLPVEKRIYVAQAEGENPVTEILDREGLEWAYLPDNLPGGMKDGLFPAAAHVIDGRIDTFVYREGEKWVVSTARKSLNKAEQDGAFVIGLRRVEDV